MEGFSQDILRRVATEKYRGRLVDTAYDRIKAEIESGEIEPGQTIREAELVARLEMSRTPVREALQRLRLEGFLVQMDRRYLVVELTDEDIHNVYRVRGVLEGMACRQAAANKTRLDVAQLQDILDEEAKAAASGDDVAALELADAFHEGLARASGNSYLQAILQSVRRFADPYRKRAIGRAGLAEQILNEHRFILECVLAGDQDKAESSARAHSRHTIRTLLGGKIDPTLEPMQALLRSRDTELADD
jgi:DNA-binding GntR family transcriptional regulator